MDIRWTILYLARSFIYGWEPQLLVYLCLNIVVCVIAWAQNDVYVISFSVIRSKYLFAFMAGPGLEYIYHVKVYSDTIMRKIPLNGR